MADDSGHWIAGLP